MTRERDPDRDAYRRSAFRIGVRVAVVSAALVLSIIVLMGTYVLWQITPAQLSEPHGTEDVLVYLDTIDLTIAVVGLGGFAVLLAGVASWIIAGQAVRPMATALRMQRTFVSDASHELRTPLTVLSARVQQLEMMVERGDPRYEVVEQLQNDTNILIDIVNDMLEAAAGAPTKRTATALRKDAGQ